MPQKKYVTLDPDKLGSRSAALRKHLCESVIGQPEACESVVRAFTPYFADMNAPNRPLCVLLFLGQTGIGKSLMATEIAYSLCGTQDAVLRISGESLREAHSVYSLIGAPPGYIGYHDENQQLSQAKLNEWRKRRIDFDSERINITKPHPSVLLFDEIDKSHSSIWNLLLGILETGELTLSNGAKTNFSQTCIILTANWGGRAISQINAGDVMGFGTGTQKDVSIIALSEMTKSLSPELVNRLDKIMVFKSFNAAALKEICMLEIGKIQRRIRESKNGFLFSVSDSAIEELCREGTSPKYGARELRRVCDRRLTQELSNLVESGQIEGGIVKVDFKDGHFRFRRLEIIIPVESKLCDAWGYVPEEIPPLPRPASGVDP